MAHELLSVLPLLGEWHGEGVLVGPAGDQRFGQWVRFAHDGRDFLAYESRTWTIAEDGTVGGPDVRESGFWRPRTSADGARTRSSCSSPPRPAWWRSTSAPPGRRPAGS